MGTGDKLDGIVSPSISGRTRDNCLISSRAKFGHREIWKFSRRELTKTFGASTYYVQLPGNNFKKKNYWAGASWSKKKRTEKKKLQTFIKFMQTKSCLVRTFVCHVLARFELKFSVFLNGFEPPTTCAGTGDKQPISSTSTRPGTGDGRID